MEETTAQTTSVEAKPRFIPPFADREKARQAALKSHQPDSARYVQAVKADSEVAQSDLFRRERLGVVRAQLVRLDKLISEELDPMKIDRLASAVARLSERERQLAGRPLPGSLKPTADKPKARRNTPAPEPEDLT